MLKIELYKLRKQSGFTLIELIVVIVILGIVSAVAAPYFLNVQSNARVATLNGFIGSFNAADSLVMEKAMIAGVDNKPGEVTIPHTDIKLQDGYLSIAPENINNVMNVDGLMMSASEKSDIPSTYVYFGDKALTFKEIASQRCFVHLSRSLTVTSEGKKTVGPIVIRRFFEGC